MVRDYYFRENFKADCWNPLYIKMSNYNCADLLSLNKPDIAFEYELKLILGEWANVLTSSYISHTNQTWKNIPLASKLLFWKWSQHKYLFV